MARVVTRKRGLADVEPLFPKRADDDQVFLLAPESPLRAALRLAQVWLDPEERWMWHDPFVVHRDHDARDKVGGEELIDALCSRDHWEVDLNGAVSSPTELKFTYAGYRVSVMVLPTHTKAKTPKADSEAMGREVDTLVLYFKALTAARHGKEIEYRCQLAEGFEVDFENYPQFCVDMARLDPSFRANGVEEGDQSFLFFSVESLPQIREWTVKFMDEDLPMTIMYEDCAFLGEGRPVHNVKEEHVVGCEKTLAAFCSDLHKGDEGSRGNKQPK